MLGWDLCRWLRKLSAAGSEESYSWSSFRRQRKRGKKTDALMIGTIGHSIFSWCQSYHYRRFSSWINAKEFTLNTQGKKEENYIDWLNFFSSPCPKIGTEGSWKYIFVLLAIHSFHKAQDKIISLFPFCQKFPWGHISFLCK